MNSELIIITEAGQWSGWASVRPKEYFTAKVMKGTVNEFTGTLTIERKLAGADDATAEGVNAMTVSWHHPDDEVNVNIVTVPGPNPDEGEWVYRAGVADGGQWQGQALLEMRISD